MARSIGPVALTLDGEGPLYRRLYGGLRRAIRSGRLPVGSRLPSTRALAEEHGVSRNVVLLAYELLASEGYAEGRPGAGTFVALPALEGQGRRRRPADGRAPAPGARLSAYGTRVAAAGPPHPSPLAAARPPALDFRYGAVAADELARKAWRRLLQRHAQRPYASYLPPEGHPLLREELARYLGQSRGMSLDASRVLVVNGSQQALDLIARLFLDPGDVVVVEDPGYRGAHDAFAAAGARVVAVPVGAAGLDVDTAPPEADGAKLVYVTPSHQFPLGGVMPVGARLALLAWARKHGATIVEDDYDSEYRYDGPPLEAVHALDRELRTVYVGTLSKVLFPALRLGYLVARPELVPVFARAKWLADRHTPAVLQLAVADFLREGHFARHLRRTRKRNAARRAALLDEIERRLGARVQAEGANAGVHIVLWLPGLERARFARFLEHARGRGVGLDPVAPNYRVPPRRAGILLGYGSLAEAEIREGVRRIAAAYRDAEAGR